MKYLFSPLSLTWLKLSKLFYNFYYSNKVNSFFSFAFLKLVTLTVVTFYSIILIIIFYYLFKNYRDAITYLNEMQKFNMSRDLHTLLYNFPLTEETGKVFNSDTIYQIYDIHGITHYSDFFYARNPDLKISHKILNYEPLAASKFSSLIMQDIINEHAHLVAELTHEFLVRVFKYSLPLAGSLALLLTLSFIETTPQIINILS